MTREAHFRRSWPEADGTWTDDVIYGLLREEWQVHGPSVSPATPPSFGQPSSADG